MSEHESHEQRHARASEVFSRFVPGVEPERVARSFTNRLGALGSFAFDVVGHMWSRPELSRRDRSLMIISVLAAQGRDEELEGHTTIGLQHGLTRSEIEEINLHVAAYAGFPAAMAANRYMDAAFKKAGGVTDLPRRTSVEPKSDEQREIDGSDILRTLTSGLMGADPTADAAALEARLGDIGAIAHRWAFGEIWSRPELSRRDRSLVVISILVAIQALDELKIHVRGGLHHGLTRVEIDEVVTHLSLYCGIPRALDAQRAVKAAYAAIDDAAATA